MSGPSSPRQRVERRIVSALSRFEHWLLAIPVVALGLVTGALAAAKSGPALTQVHIWSLDSWPTPAPVYPPLTYGFRAVARLLGTETQAGYTVISVAAIVAVLIFSPLILTRRRPGPEGRWITLVLISGPMIWILAGGIGRTDPLIILAGLILGVLGSSRAWSAFAALLAVLGNPEQAVVISVTLLLVSGLPELRNRRRGAITALSLSGAAWLGLTLWSWSLEIPSRPDYFVSLWKQSLSTFFVQFPLEIYAGYGLAVLVIAWALMGHTRIPFVLAFIGVFVIPITVTALTLDQSRVLVCCSIAAVTAIVHEFGPSLYAHVKRLLRYPLAVTFVITALLPAIELAATNVRTPWAEVYPFVQTYLVTPLVGG